MTPDDAERLIESLTRRVADLERRYASLAGRAASLEDPRGRVFLARPGGGTNSAWQELWPDGSGTAAALVDFTGGRVSDAEPLIDPGNAVAVMAYPAAGVMKYVRLPAGVIPVALTMDGGGNGTNTTRPDYTYTVKAMTATQDGTVTAGQTLATGAEPIVPPMIGQFAAATIGLAMPASDGGYALLVAFVDETVEECS